MKTFSPKIILAGFLCLLFSVGLQAQQFDIFDLMERRDMRLTEIEAIANRYFDSAGTGRGTGYKQFQRWLYEAKFHTDEKGFLLPPDYDFKEYLKAKPMMGLEANAAGAWTEKGPFGWTRTSGWNPGVGRVTSVAVHATNPSIMYITSPGGGLWRSLDGGSTWSPRTDANSNWMNMFSVAIDPANSSIVLAGSSGGVLIRSTDGGETFSQVTSGLGTVWKILFHPTNSQLIFVASNNGVYRSTNGGSNWTRVYTTSRQDIEFKPDDPNIMYASGTTVTRSTDGGLTWTALGSAQGIVASARTLIGVTPANPNRVYLVQANGSEFGRMYRSDDAGQTFTVTVTGSAASCTNFFGYSTNGCGTGGQAGYDMAICVNPNDANDVFIAGIIVWRSTNGGSNFTAMTAWSLPNSIGYNHADVHALEWVNNSIYSGSDGGVYRSNDLGDNWTDLSSGLGTRQFYRIANSVTNTELYSGGAQDNGSSIHKASGWIDWLGADGMDCLISPTSETLLWGTSQNGSIYRTTNGGSSYSNLPKPGTGNWVTPLAIEKNTNVIYGGWNGVYKSTDNGSSWTKISGTTITSNVVALTVAPSNAAYIYASVGSNLYATTNGGSTWTTYAAPATINAIAVSPLNPQKIWLACNSNTNRVFVSTDGGATYTNISSGLPSITPRSVTVDDNTEESVYVGANLGVFYTDNNTTGWIDISDNLPKVAINEVEIQQSGSILRIATYGRGVWQRALYGTVAPCVEPGTLNASNITTNSANLSWLAAGGALSYNLEYKAASSNTWINASSNLAVTSFGLSGLTEGTTYDWRVQSNCASSTSNFVSAQFTTAVACPDPTGLNANNITMISATLVWTGSGEANSYDVEYKENSSNTWLAAATATTQTSVSLNNLNAATTYNWRVRANCASGQGSFANSQFTTAAPPVCTDVYESNNTNKQAKAISLNTLINAAIGASGDEDWFKISTGNTKLTNVKVTLTGLPADYDVYLYNKSLQLVGSSTNTGTADEEIIYNTTTTRATYYIKVIAKGNAFDASSCYGLLAEISNSPWNPANQAPVISRIASPVDATLYPNPTTGRTLLQFHSGFEGFADVRVVSASGVSLQNFGIVLRKGINQVVIEAGTLPKGLFQVQIRNDKMRIIKPMMVIR